MPRPSRPSVPTLQDTMTCQFVLLPQVLAFSHIQHCALLDADKRAKDSVWCKGAQRRKAVKLVAWL